MTDLADFETTVGDHVKTGKPSGLPIRWPNQPWKKPTEENYWWLNFNYTTRLRGSLGAQIDARQNGNVVLQVSSPVGTGTTVHTQSVQAAMDLMDEVQLGPQGKYRFAEANPVNLGEIDSALKTNVITEFVMYD